MHLYKKHEDNISSEYNTGETISLPKSSKSFKKIGKGSDKPHKSDSMSEM